MSNFEKAVEVLREAYREPSMSPVHACDIMANALEAAGLLAPDVQAIRTQEELEALAREDADAIVLAGLVGAPRPACTLYEMHKAGQEWTLPATVIATGDQVRAAREAMEESNE